MLDTAGNLLVAESFGAAQEGGLCEVVRLVGTIGVRIDGTDIDEHVLDRLLGDASNPRSLLLELETATVLPQYEVRTVIVGVFGVGRVTVSARV